MPHPETDAEFRARLLRIVIESDRQLARMAYGARLDALGRRYDRFRYGAPLKIIEEIMIEPLADDWA